MHHSRAAEELFDLLKPDPAWAPALGRADGLGGLFRSCVFLCTRLMFGSVLFGGGGETEVDFPVEAPWPRHMVQGRLSVKSVSLRSFQECLTFGKPGEEPIAQWLQPKTHAEIRIDVLQEMAQNLPKPARVLVSQGTCSNCTEARLRRGIGLRRRYRVCIVCLVVKPCRKETGT